jgi:hypothetical protein
MGAEATVTAVRVGWLVLCGMMLFSRFLFQGAGPTAMRRFLDAWKGSRTHRAWGLGSLAFGAGLAASAARDWPGLGWADRAWASGLVAVLAADGLLNLVPSWFGHFKERMQDAWVRRHGRGEAGSDRRLFGTVNLALGLASLAVGAAVALYRPLDPAWLGVSAALAAGLTLGLVGACRWETRGSS